VQGGGACPASVGELIDLTGRMLKHSFYIMVGKVNPIFSFLGFKIAIVILSIA